MSALPPPVEYTSALGRAWRAALGLLVAAAVAVPLAWALPHLASQAGLQVQAPRAIFAWLAQPALQIGLACGAGAVAWLGVWLARRASFAAERTLRWDGQDWILPSRAGNAPDQRGHASLILDLGPWMLVRFLPSVMPYVGRSLGYTGVGRGRPTWLPFYAARDPERWAALRGALWACRTRR